MNLKNLKDQIDSPMEGSKVNTVNITENSVSKALERHPFLKGMSSHQRQLLSDCAMLSHFDAGEFLLREGDPANRFYLITNGRIVIEAHVEGKGRVPIETLGAGDVLGWSWLFEPYFWHFDAQAAEPTDVVFLYGTPLREECENDHDFGYELIKRMTEIVIDRLQMTRKKYVHDNF